VLRKEGIVESGHSGVLTVGGIGGTLLDNVRMLRHSRSERHQTLSGGIARDRTHVRFCYTHVYLHGEITVRMDNELVEMMERLMGVCEPSSQQKIWP